jgi:SAM-dependent methyltransferase
LRTILQQALMHATGPARSVVRRGLAHLGLAIQPIGTPYLDARATLRSAREQGVSLATLLARQVDDPRKLGLEDRVVEAMEQRGLLGDARSVIEIGPGTGPYLERFATRGVVCQYHAYEPDVHWRRYLRRTVCPRYPGCRFVLPAADGESLRESASGRFDLVQAHFVFTYIPTVKTLAYVAEAARVLRPGGHLVADFFLDDTFDVEVVRAWLDRRWKYAVVTPRLVLEHWLDACGLAIVDRFAELRGASTGTYLILRREMDGARAG